MELSFLLQGIVIGFSIAAPVGPIGVLCIRRTLTAGRLTGFFSGLGAATADGIYGSIAGFGLTFISGFLVNERVWLQLIGGIFLCYLGLKTFLAEPTMAAAKAKESGLLSAYGSTFFLTLTNPMTILSFATVFAGLGIGNMRGNYMTAGILVLGVFLGSGFWWLLLSSGVSWFRSQFNLKAFKWVNRIAGVLIMAFGAIALSSLWV